MPDYGNTQARNFSFPYPEQQNLGAGAMQQNQQAAPQLGMESPSNLQYVRDTTQGVYDKFYKLKSFVSSMWKNYNIDVTNPDFSDEFATKANQIYQESIADLKFTADDLSNSQRMLERDAAKNNQILVQGMDLQADPYSRNVGQAFIPQKNITDRTKAVIDDYQKLFYDKNTRDQANKNLESYSGEIDNDIAIAKQQGRMDIVQMLEEDKKSIKSALYSAEKDKALAIASDRAATAKARAKGETKLDYTNLWEQWDQVRQGDLSSLEGMQGKYGPIFVPGSLHYNYAKGKVTGLIDKGANSANDKGTTTKFSANINDIRGGYLQALQQHDKSYEDLTYDGLLNNVHDLVSKFPELKDVSYESDPEFFQSMEYMIGDLTSGGKEGEYTVRKPDGSKTKIKYPTNEQNFTRAIGRLQEIANSKGLVNPKDSKRFMLPDDAVITNVEKTSPLFSNNKIKITVESPSEGIIDDEKLDPLDPKDREYLRELIYSNDASMNSEIKPNYSRVEGQTKEEELTPEQIKARELIEKYGG